MCVIFNFSILSHSGHLVHVIYIYIPENPKSMFVWWRQVSSAVRAQLHFRHCVDDELDTTEEGVGEATDMED